MSSRIALTPPPIGRGPVHKLALALVWLAVASSAVVFTEPAPADLVSMGLIVFLPLVGLVASGRLLLVYLGAWLVISAASFVASSFAGDIQRATVHSAITLYLSLASFVIAGFVAWKPHGHARLLLQAYVAAALLGAVAGIIGYFGLVPGAAALFTKFDRASGAFKDPNVYGPFLVPAIVYLVHLLVTRPLTRILGPALLATPLALALLLSFSRGAWLALLVSLALYGYIGFVTSPSNRQRLRIVGLGCIAAIAALVLVALALQLDSVARLFDARAALSHSYDEGPEGRFGGQLKALEQLLANPLGIGGRDFGGRVHHEDPHNVYLSMFLNAGWLGGLVYLALVLATVMLGLRHAMRRSLTQPLFVVAFASLVGLMIEGAVIDTDHWRHFFLLMGLCWGLMAGDQRAAREARIVRAVPSVTIHTLARRAPSRVERIRGLAKPRLVPDPVAPVTPRRRRRAHSPKRAGRIVGMVSA